MSTERESMNRIESLASGKMTESIKSMQWGVQHRNLKGTGKFNDSPQNIFFPLKNIEDLKHRQIPDTPNYEEIPESPFQPNFKIKEDHAIDALQNLRKEFEFLKNMTIEEENVFSNAKSSVRERSISSSSRRHTSLSRSNKMHTESKASFHQKQNKFDQYLKTHLEGMLTNSLNKIDQLLNNEVEYKRQLHELTVQLELNNKKDKHKHELIDDQETISVTKKLQEKIDKLSGDLEQALNENARLQQATNNKNKDLTEKQNQLKHRGDEIRKLKQNLLLQKEKHLNEEIEKKRVIVEKEMLQKEKNMEINHLKALIKEYQGKTTNHSQRIIQELKQEIQLKNKRYELLLGQISTERSDNQLRIQEEIMDKIKKIQQNSEQTIKQQIASMRAIIKEFEYKIGQGQMSQQKLKILEKEIELENEQKEKFIEELQKFITENEELANENDQLKKNLANQEEMLRKYSSENILTKNTHIQESQIESRNLPKLHTYETGQIQNHFSRIKSEYESYRREATEREHQKEEENRQLLRKVDRLEFEVEKTRRESQFQLQMESSRRNNELQINSKYLAQAKQDRDEWQRQFEKMKSFYEGKLAEMRNAAQAMERQYQSQTAFKDEEIKKLRKMLDENIKSIEEQYQGEKTRLVASLAETNKKLVQQSSRLVQAEGELIQLRTYSKKMMGMGVGIQHLWAVKESEYANLNDLIRELKQD